MLYLYALLPERPAHPPVVGVGGQPVRLLDCEGLVAAVSQLEAALCPTLEALRAHERVVAELAARAPAILPARFGQLQSDSADLADTLRGRLPTLRAALAQVDGCVQMDLRLFGDQPQPSATGSGWEEPADRPGWHYLQARIDARERAARVPELRSVLEGLSGFVRAERVRRSQRASLLASVYHLVARSDAEAYLERVSERASRLDSYRLKASGPWAPYAFANGVSE